MDLEHIQLPWLGSFVAVVERGSVTAAAKAVHLSQPRVSAHIAALESAAGGPLFERLPRGMTPTELGLQLLPFAKGIIGDLRAAANSLSATRRTLEGTVRVASYPGASAVLLAPTMQQFAREYPDVTFDLHEGDANAVEWAVARGVVDWAIRPSGAPRRFPALPSAHLCHERIVLVGHQNDHIRGDDLNTLAGRTVIVSGDPHDGWVDYRDELAAASVPFVNVMVAAMPTTVIALVAAGMGVGVLGSFAARSCRRPVTRIIELPGRTWQRELRIVTNDSKPMRAVSQAFLELLHERTPDLVRG